MTWCPTQQIAPPQLRGKLSVAWTLSNEEMKMGTFRKWGKRTTLLFICVIKYVLILSTNAIMTLPYDNPLRWCVCVFLSPLSLSPIALRCAHKKQSGSLMWMSLELDVGCEQGCNIPYFTLQVNAPNFNIIYSNGFPSIKCTVYINIRHDINRIVVKSSQWRVLLLLHKMFEINKNARTTLSTVSFTFVLCSLAFRLSFSTTFKCYC